MIRTLWVATSVMSSVAPTLRTVEPSKFLQLRQPPRVQPRSSFLMNVSMY